MIRALVFCRRSFLSLFSLFLLMSSIHVFCHDTASSRCSRYLFLFSRYTCSVTTQLPLAVLVISSYFLDTRVLSRHSFLSLFSLFVLMSSIHVFCHDTASSRCSRYLFLCPRYTCSVTTQLPLALLVICSSRTRPAAGRQRRHVQRCGVVGLYRPMALSIEPIALATEPNPEEHRVVVEGLWTICHQ